MSTKSTIAHGTNFHLYHEVLDESYVYLELESVQFEAGYNRVLVPIPMHIWEFIRHYPGIDLDWAGKTDPEIRQYVEDEVDDRIRQYQATDQGRSGLIRFLGSMVYGSADEPRDEQIAKGTEYFNAVREHQKQIKRAIGELERTNKKE
jgi:hypothetical protein